MSQLFFDITWFAVQILSLSYLSEMFGAPTLPLLRLCNRDTDCLQSGKLSLASRLEEDPQFAQRIAIQAAAQRSIVGLRYSRALAKAFLARSTASSTDPVSTQFQIGDQVFYWRGVSEKGIKPSSWAFRCRGPGVVIGR